MKKENTATRLRKIMQDRNLRQVDILNLATPYCNMYGVKMNKSDISQYCAGKTEPNQNKLYVLGKALGVSEAWLMGFDVPMDRSTNTKYANLPNIDTIAFEITGRSLQHSPTIFDAICKGFNEFPMGDNDGVFADNEKNIAIGNVLKSSSISYDEKAFALKTVIDIVLFDIKKNEINIFYKSEGDTQEDQVDRLIRTVKRLNDIGLDKVIDYATDLSNMSNYTKGISNEKVVHISTKQRQEYIAPIASHERTDIEVTEEMKKHDDAFFDE